MASPEPRCRRTQVGRRIRRHFLGELFARVILDNLGRFIVPAIAGPARLVPPESLATPDLSDVALRNAAQRGRLRAIRTPTGTWRSSKQWVDAYRQSRYASLRVTRRGTVRRSRVGPSDVRIQ